MSSVFLEKPKDGLIPALRSHFDSVEEVVHLTMAALDLPRSQLFVYEGKGSKDRVVYLSNDAKKALTEYLEVRPSSRAKRVFLVEKGRFKGKPIQVRGIQYCMQKY